MLVDLYGHLYVYFAKKRIQVCVVKTWQIVLKFEVVCQGSLRQIPSKFKLQFQNLQSS